MISPLTALCGQLDQMRAAATPGEWSTYWGNRIASGVLVTSPGGVQLDYGIASLDDRDHSDNEDNPASGEDDAALIVAAVNALPQLTAALRAVDDLLSREGVPLHGSKTIKVGALRAALATVAGS